MWGWGNPEFPIDWSSGCTGSMSSSPSLLHYLFLPLMVSLLKHKEAVAALQISEYFSVIWAAPVGFCSDLEVLQHVILPGSLILPIPFLSHSLALAAQESFNLIPELWLYLTERTKTPSFIQLWIYSKFQGISSTEIQVWVQPGPCFLTDFLWFREQRRVSSHDSPTITWMNKQQCQGAAWTRPVLPHPKPSPGNSPHCRKVR